jgi:carbon monoxide dehydrogenase subunit G
MKVGVAAIRGTYKGKVAIVDKRPPTSYTLQIEGSGGPGFVKGSAKIALAPEGEGTGVKVDGDGQVGGMLAGVGQRMLPGVAKMLMNQFFECLIARANATASAEGSHVGGPTG